MNIDPWNTAQEIAFRAPYPPTRTLARVRVVDPLGRRIVERRVSGMLQLIELDTRNWAGGLYAAELTVEGLSIGHAKFEIVR